IGQLAVAQEPRDLEKGGVFGQLLDRVSAIAKDPLVAVDESDGAPTGGGIQKSRVVAHQTVAVGVVRLDALQLHGANGFVGNRDRVGLAGAAVLYFERAALNGGR